MFELGERKAGKHPSFGHASLAGHLDTPMHEVDLACGMCVRVDAHRAAEVERHLVPAPVKVETPGIGVDFNRDVVFRAGFEDFFDIDLVAGPTTGGIILAFETGRQLGVRAIFAEEVRDPDGSTRREFRRGFHIEPGERVLLVDDILTTGGSLLAMLPAVEAMGGEIIECVVLVDRSGGGTNRLTSPSTGRAYPLRSLWRLELPTFEPGAAS